MTNPHDGNQQNQVLSESSNWVAETTDWVSTNTDLAIHGAMSEANSNYVFTVSNNSANSITGAQLMHILPPELNVSWLCLNATAGAICPSTSGTGDMVLSLDLPAGASMDFEVQWTNPTVNQKVVVTVTVPDGMNDIQIQNNVFRGYLKDVIFDAGGFE